MCHPAVFTAMGASAGTAGTLAAVSQIGLIAGGTMMSINAQKQAMIYQQQQAEFQKKQFKMQADAAEIETIQAENDRKRKYLAQLNENRALFSKMNITTDSPSYRAFLKANKETVKKDIQRLRLKGTEKRLAALYGQTQADLSGRAAESKFRSNRLQTVGRSLMGAYPIADEAGFLG
jgi:hypothetical protein